MLIISECKTCNADKATCPIKKELSDNLKKAGIKKRLKYKCSGWQRHLSYKVGDKIEFHFIEYGGHGGELSGETLIGVIHEISKKKPIYMVLIDKENRSKIDKEYSGYDRFVTPYVEESYYVSEEEAKYFTVPVKESLIVGITD